VEFSKSDSDFETCRLPLSGVLNGTYLVLSFFDLKPSDLAVRTGWPEAAHPLRKQLLTVHDKLEADIAARDEKAIAYATGMLRGELNRVRETIGRYLFVLDADEYLRK
jgi:hypothetical protein